MDDGKRLIANIVPFGLRMQPELKSMIEDAAKKSSRSMNAEIVARLEQTFMNWPRIALSERAHERAMAASAEDRERYEAELQAYAVDLFGRRFRKYNDYIGRFDEVFLQAIRDQAVGDEEVYELREEYFRFMRTFMKRLGMPEDELHEAFGEP